MHTLPACSCKFIAHFLYVLLVKQISHDRKKNKKRTCKASWQPNAVWGDFLCPFNDNLAFCAYVSLSLVWLHNLHTTC